LGFYQYFYHPRKDSLSYQIDLLSKKVDDFFVIQIGANDGITHDPIHKFIKRDKWKGVLLEPQKDVFENLLKPLYAKQEGIILVQAALGHKEGETTIYRIGFSQDRWATGLTSFNKSVLVKAFASGHVARQAAKQGISVPDDPSQHIIEEKVPVITSRSLLTTYKVEKIDLLQIDSEGFDFEIIKMFDLTEVRPTYISYENSHLSPTDRVLCESHLRENEYQILHFGGNSLALTSTESMH
jgi:FkbM family methyltransferase